MDTDWKPILYDLLPTRDIRYDTEIVSIMLPHGSFKDFHLVFRCWPDAGPTTEGKMQIEICLKGAVLREAIRSDDLVGYEIHEIALDTGAQSLRLDTTIRSVRIDFDELVVT